MTTAYIMACVPADTSDIPPLDVELPRPTSLYSLIQCDNPGCARDMWIGPRQLARAAEFQVAVEHVFKLCYVCAAQAQYLMGDIKVESLGGGAGVEGVVRG